MISVTASTVPTTTTFVGRPCHYCNVMHLGMCPRIKSIEYHPNGAVKRVELKDV